MVLSFIYHQLILVEALICFGFAIFVFYRAYKLTQNSPMLWLTVSSIFAFFSYLLPYLTGFIKPNSALEMVAYYAFSVTNTLIALTLLIFINALVLIKLDRVPMFSHLGTLIVGFGLAFFCDISLMSLEYDHRINNWLPYYSIHTAIIPMIMITIYIIYFGIYLLPKISQNIKNRTIPFSLLGLTLLLLWNYSVFSNSFHIFRVYIYPLWIFFVALDVYRNPLDLLLSTNKVSEIILFTKYNKPILHYNAEKRIISRDFEDTILFKTGENLMVEKLPKEHRISQLISEGGELISLNMYEMLNIVIIATKIDKNIISASNYFVHKASKTIDFNKLNVKVLLTPEEEQKIKIIFDQVLDSIKT